MKLINALNQVTTGIKFTRESLKGISRLVNDPKLSRSYFPESDRKPKMSIWWDNLLWLARHGEVNRYYYVYGLDKKQDAQATEVLSYKEFRRIRDSRNLRPNREGYNYVCILRDKFIFSQFLASLGFPAPKNVALLNQQQITRISDMQPMSLEAFVADTQINGFCKKLAGILGEGAFPLRIDKGKLYSKDSALNVESLKERITGQYLLQELITQHPQMSALHPSSVNTVRMITFNNNGHVDVFCAALRIGTKGRSVDNWASGGIVVGVDLNTGRLQKEGLFKPGYGGRVDKHPDSGVIFENFQIPYFHEGMKMACQLHSYLYGIHSVGWDVAITPDGPIFIEGNDDWEGGIPMSIEKNFKSRFLKMFAN